MRQYRRAPLPVSSSRWTLILLIVAAVLLFQYCREHRPNTGQVPSPPSGPPGPSTTAGVHLALGNPSGATEDPGQPANYLLLRQQFAASYNRDHGEPNWVAWRLVESDLGPTDRNNFFSDTLLPSNWYRVTPSDYTGTGYDRGHLCPSGDRTDSVENNRAVFTMANIFPQSPDSNRGPWERLEAYCRTLARQGNELYIVAGLYGDQGTIANGHVAVPKQSWKVIVVLPVDDNGDDAVRVSTGTRVIAVDLPNINGIKQDDWRRYRTTVAAIEQSTGYNLLSRVRPDVQRVIEARVDPE